MTKLEIATAIDALNELIAERVERIDRIRQRQEHTVEMFGDAKLDEPRPSIGETRRERDTRLIAEHEKTISSAESARAALRALSRRAPRSSDVAGDA